MKVIVLDVSVAVKWFLPRQDESLVEEALRLLQDHTEEKVDFIAPDFFWAEFGNVLWKSVRRQRWTAKSATEAARHMKALKLSTVSSEELLDDALPLAMITSQTVYDCLYVTLAIRSGVDMVTADERLADALAAKLPVRWLGTL